MADTNIGFVRSVFSQQVPATYEMVNHILTLGLDIAWRKQAAKIAAMADGGQWADLCTGTGETAVYLSKLAPKDTTVYAIDLSVPMLEQARKKPRARRIRFVSSDTLVLPFADESFDLLVMSFATRNINQSKDILVRTFTEYYRVLKPGGRFVNVETSRPSLWVVRRVRDLYVKLFVKSIGGAISGSSMAYGYLAHTIPRFYGPQELRDIIRLAGFTKVNFQRQVFGLAAIHQGMKGCKSQPLVNDSHPFLNKGGDLSYRD